MTHKTVYRRLSAYRLNRTHGASDSHRKLNRSQSLQHYAIQYQPKRSTVPIPTEILDRIASLALTCAAESLVDRFNAIAPFTLASFNFRQIALCRFLQTLHVDSISDWTKLRKLLASSQTTCSPAISSSVKWTSQNICAYIHHYLTQHRTLHITAHVLGLHRVLPFPLNNLTTLHIDYALSGFPLERLYSRYIFDIMLNPGLSSLQNLHLTSLPWITTALLKKISASFPDLKELLLSVTERLYLGCCWICLEDTAGTIVHSPVPDEYLTVEDLAVRIYSPPTRASFDLR